MKKLYVQSTIDYVEKHIEECLNVDLIANAIGLSKVYMHRLFYIYTGMTLMEYCRKRKLEYSRWELTQNNLAIDVAFKYGFNSYRAFSRAFINEFNLSPSKVKEIYYELPGKIIIKQIGGIKMLPYLSDTEIIEMDEIYCLSHFVISKEPEHNVIDFMMEYEQKYNLNVIATYGYDIPVSEEESKKGLRGYEYLLALSKNDFDSFSGPTVTKKVIPKSRYLSLLITDPFVDPFERIPNGWRKLFDDVKKSYEYNDSNLSTCLEEKIEHGAETNMRIYTPIK